MNINFVFGDNDPYINCLKENKRKVFFLVRYAGNAGDVLIRMATKEILKDLEITWSESIDAADIILWPGGSFSMWRSGIKTFKNLILKYPKKKFILGPSTLLQSVFMVKLQLSKFRKNIIGIFARDPNSMRYLNRGSFCKNVNIGLSHDVSFYYFGSQWVENYKKLSSEEYILAVFRNDLESEGCRNMLIRSLCQILPYEIGKKIYPVFNKSSYNDKCKSVKRRAKLKGAQLLIEEISKSDFNDYLNTILKAKEIHTDCLHVFILSAMLGKKVFAYKTAYDKLERIYFHSMKKIPGVVFA